MNSVLQGTPDSISKTFWVKSKTVFGCIFRKSKKNILHILLEKTFEHIFTLKFIHILEIF